jgi:predicted RNA-binding Zn-ribbon protein involved in translation (DUF1610 family)
MFQIKMTSSNEALERQPSLTATLYCSSCTHESRINGGWILHVRTDTLEYECPNCGTAIGSHQAESALTTQSGGSLRTGSAD